MKESVDVPDFSRYLRYDTLKDGRIVRIRSIRPADKEALLRGFHRLSKQSIHSRFFGGKHDLSDSELKYYTEVDFKHHVAIVVELEDDGFPLGVGRFNLDYPDKPLIADVAVTVDEEYHGLGVGTMLMHHLSDMAEKLGIAELNADILRSNLPMLRIIERLGRVVRKQKAGEFVNIRIKLSVDTD